MASGSGPWTSRPPTRCSSCSASTSSRPNPAPPARRRRTRRSSSWTTCAVTVEIRESGPEHDLLGALPERQLTELAQVLRAGFDRQEVVAGELADDRGEVAAAVGEEDLGLAVAAGVPEDLSGCRVAGVVLEGEIGLEVAHRDPARLATPAHVNQLALEGQQLLERRARLRRPLLLHPGAELVRSRCDRQRRHRSPS